MEAKNGQKQSSSLRVRLSLVMLIIILGFKYSDSYLKHPGLIAHRWYPRCPGLNLISTILLPEFDQPDFLTPDVLLDQK